MASVVAQPETFNIFDTLNATEIEYYDTLYVAITGSKDTPSINGSNLYEFLTRSQLDQDTLASIWRTCVDNSPTTMNKLQFYKYMRCVALVQNDAPKLSYNAYLMAKNFPYLPLFTGIPQPKSPYYYPGMQIPEPDMLYPSISSTELNSYEQFIDNADTSIPGTLKAREARDILRASSLPKDILYKIWYLCEGKKPNEERGKGFLVRNEFIVTLHIIRKTKLGYPVPEIIPKNIEAFSKEYAETQMGNTANVSGKNLPYSGQSSGNFTGTGRTSSKQYSGSADQQGSTAPKQVEVQVFRRPLPQLETGNSQVVTLIEEEFKEDPQEIVKSMREFMSQTRLLSKKYSEEMVEFKETMTKMAALRTKMIKEASSLIVNVEKATNGRRSLKRSLADVLAELFKVCTDSEQNKKMNKLMREMDYVPKNFSFIEDNVVTQAVAGGQNGNQQEEEEEDDGFFD